MDRTRIFFKKMCIPLSDLLPRYPQVLAKSWSDEEILSILKLCNRKSVIQTEKDNFCNKVGTSKRIYADVDSEVSLSLLISLTKIY